MYWKDGFLIKKLSSNNLKNRFFYCYHLDVFRLSRGEYYTMNELLRQLKTLARWLRENFDSSGCLGYVKKSTVQRILNCAFREGNYF